MNDVSFQLYSARNFQPFAEVFLRVRNHQGAWPLGVLEGVV